MRLALSAHAPLSMAHREISIVEIFSNVRKMLFIFNILACLTLSEGAVLLWSPERLRLSAFLHSDDFEDILNDLKRPHIVAFKVDFDKISTVVPRKLENLHSAYVPAANLLLENSQDLGDDLDLNTELIYDSLNQYKKNGKYENVLLVISFYGNRVKRQDQDRNVTELTPTVTEPPVPEPTGPVVYNGEGSVIVYSSQAPRLRINSTVLFLGPSKIVTLDNRDGYTRLIATVVVDDGKVILRFKFPSANGYWSLTSVEVVDQRRDENKSYNLTITCGVGAAHSFSYHCHKDTVFKDAAGNVELVLYKLQAQPDAKKGRFSDAYNCVNFMTGPIWSGLLVTVSLIIGFFIALAALGDIKTMDKFDNYKTKQLNITVAE